MRILFISLLLLPVLGSAQNTYELKYPDGTVLAIFENGQVRGPASGDILYTVKGGIIFAGDSQEKEDIVYGLKLEDLFGRKKGYLYEADLEKVLLTIKRGYFYLGESRNLEPVETLGYIRKKNDGLYIFHDELRETEMGRMTGTEIPSAQLALAFHLLSNANGLQQLLQARLDSLQSPLTGDVIGAIRARWAAGAEFEWVWDGEIFRPRYLGDIYFEWTFDGETIQPKWQHHIYEEFTWDGETLASLWRPGDESYTWDGRLLKPYWSTGNERDYIIEEGRVSPYLGNTSGMEWEIVGELPIPLIALLVLGIAFR